MADEYINKKDVVNLGVMMQTHLWTREQTYNAIFCLPSADVAPVVRCKDCKWCEGYGYVCVCHNPRYGDGYANYQPPHINDEYWCADGERKDDDIC